MAQESAGLIWVVINFQVADAKLGIIVFVSRTLWFRRSLRSYVMGGMVFLRISLDYWMLL
jgi:hypothetical protein